MMIIYITFRTLVRIYSVIKGIASYLRNGNCGTINGEALCLTFGEYCVVRIRGKCSAIRKSACTCTDM